MIEARICSCHPEPVPVCGDGVRDLLSLLLVAPYRIGLPLVLDPARQPGVWSPQVRGEVL